MAIYGVVAYETKLGVLFDLRDAHLAKQAGFDYAELSLRDIAQLDSDAYDKLLRAYGTGRIRTYSAHLLLPDNIKLVGPGVNTTVQHSYLRHTLHRAHELGIRLIVVGSGASRTIPNSFDGAVAFEQMLDFGRFLAPLAESYQMTIAVLPMRKHMSSVLNTVEQVMDLVRAVNHKRFKLAVDHFHLVSERQSPKLLLPHLDHVAHVRMANPAGRVMPLNGTEFDYADWFAALRDLKHKGYRGGLTVPGEVGRGGDFLRDAPKSIAFLREQLAQRRHHHREL